ncbi:MAG: hypothetical protein OEM46_06530, partial [Ignavibacteria bacterium]|nr:hypothetical protein [Ignavibacteria bacterium]
MGEILVGTGIYELPIYRSLDGGETWIESDSGMVGYLVPEEVLINSKGYLYTNGQGLGTYRSTTNGMSWEELPGIGGYTQTSCLYIKENDNIYVGISDAPPYRIVKSTDDGDSWIDITNGIDGQVESITSLGDTLFIGVLGSGLNKSTNDGETWINLSSSWMLCLTKNSSNELFAHNFNGIGKSTDGGITWIEILTNFYSCHTILPDVQGNIFVAGNTIKRSSDGGNTWIDAYEGINAVGGNSLYFSQSGNLYFSTWGIYKSTDLGDSWKQVGFNNSYIYDITLDESDNIYVTTPNKIYKSVDLGNTWIFSGDGMHNQTEVIHCANDGNLWTGNNHSSVYHLYYSSDKGKTWDSIQGFEGVYDIDDNSSGDVYVGAYGGLYV